MSSIPDRSIRICADRGGTFCDVSSPQLSVLAMNRPRCTQLGSRVSLLDFGGSRYPTSLSWVFPFLRSNNRSYPRPENPKERKEVVVKLCELQRINPSELFAESNRLRSQYPKILTTTRTPQPRAFAGSSRLSRARPFRAEKSLIPKRSVSTLFAASDVVGI
jgi:hypothetical protein